LEGGEEGGRKGSNGCSWYMDRCSLFADACHRCEGVAEEGKAKGDEEEVKSSERK
jgi:hypothetical protein